MHGASSNHSVLRHSLIFVWLATAFVSVWELNGQSRALLLSAGIADDSMVHLLVLGGAAIDAALGLAMYFYPLRMTYLLALGFMVLMTFVATLIQPALWLHLLGPLAKNIPIAAALWVLAKQNR